VPGLGTSFGRGGATTAQQSLHDADAIMVMGSSMAEQHPVGFQWVVAARERGAKIIHVDPRFTRTSAMADMWVPLRAGSDILFLGAIIHHVLENKRYFHEYVANYTNAPTIIREEFKDTEELDGVFSGLRVNEKLEKEYDPSSWLYEGTEIKGADQSATHHPDSGGHGMRGGPGGGHGHDRGGEVEKSSEHHSDPTLQHPRCVFQILKRHFARYTPEMVEQYCGVPKETFLNAAEAFISASGPDKTAAICYAVGWTQHSKGVQIIRTAAILQMLLGNIGRPGGGILALRGHASIQGSTDIPTLFDILPGYLPMPMFASDANRLSDYIKKHKAKKGVWSNFDAYFVSLMKAYYGERATAENDWCFDWIPRVTGDHSHFGYWLDMMDGKMDGLFVMGQNPAVGASNGRVERKALSKLKWLVVRDLVETETASFWLDSPEVQRGELNPDEIKTEVFLMPACGSAEKDGTFTNTQRMLQYHNKSVDGPGDSRSETWFIYHLGRRLKEKAARDPRPMHEPLRALTWNYSTHGKHAEPNVEEVLMEINGWTTADRKLIPGYSALKNDGSTTCGCWIYSGVMPRSGLNKANQREPKGKLGHGWGFAWPNDCRIIYNRASAAPDGRPWSERKKLVWWDEAKQEWTGDDTPDFTKNMPPSHKGDGKEGMWGLDGDQPFTLHADGVAWMFVSSGLKDGPLPTHYEPLESLLENPLYPKQQTNPTAKKKERADNPYAVSPGDRRFPYILSTYRLTEHHTAGGMTRTLTHLAELQPELFCEISPELANELDVEHGAWVTVVTPRSLVSARALVTPRMRPLWVNGRRMHQVGLPYHWGYKGLVKGDITNDLLVISEEPNVRIMETKALVCNVVPGRHAEGKAALDQLKFYLQRPAA
jgi:formate dehydrogenase major subunit